MNPTITLNLRATLSLILAFIFSTLYANAEEKPFGIKKRVPWTTSSITGSPDPPPPYRIERVFTKLTFNKPVILTDAPDSNRLFMVELDGKIFSFTNDPARESADLFFDMAASIEGMRRVYGLTFHPDFATNGYCYLCYVIEENNPQGTRVSRFKVKQTDPPQVDPDSEEILITWLSGGHNGGCLKFGPDGYLYISTGDGGPAFPPDPRKSGQDITNLRSSILRIDVDRVEDGQLYAIPSDNPFVDHDGARGEVWAYGFRNPWKISFDPADGGLWVGDVGWEMWEMIYRVERAGNYGWSLVEARQPVHRERERGPTPILPPTVEHSHIESRSITGGHVYHGKRLNELAGAYIYGDYVTGKLWGAQYDGKQVAWVKELVDTSLQIICFGIDYQGELYVVAYDGTIHRLVKNSAASANLDFPRKLSETGLFSTTTDHQVADGVIPYSINAEPWADGAVAERFVALPGEAKLDLYESTNVQLGFIKDTWKFPTDSVLMKTISMETKNADSSSRQRIETQIFHFDVDTWRAYTYVWNDEQTDAVLAPAEGMEKTLTISDPLEPSGFRSQSWPIASRSQCLLCHSTRGGSIYGFNLSQLNSNHDYAGVADHQLRALDHIGLFEKPLPDEPPTMPSPDDESASLEDRARSYLHVNCAHCHRRGGGGTAAIELIRDFSIAKTRLLDARPTQGTFGIHAAQVLTPGDPYRSILYYRMAKLGRGRMPHFGSNVVDENGLKLIHDWIAKWEVTDAAPDSVAKLRSEQRRTLARLESAKSLTDAHRTHLKQLLSSTSGALMLLNALDNQAINSSVRDVALSTGATHEDIQIRDLFERFIPEDKRSKRLGTSIDPAKILSLRGDASRGRDFFFRAAGVQCKNCHRIGKEGVELGPDLSQIGKKYNREQLLESILQPSKQIDPKFLTHLVETASGKVFSGLLSEKSDEEIVIKDATNKAIRIPAEEVELLVPSQKSLMPELLLRDMTADQVADLISFLHSLR